MTSEINPEVHIPEVYPVTHNHDFKQYRDAKRDQKEFEQTLNRLQKEEKIGQIIDIRV